MKKFISAVACSLALFGSQASAGVIIDATVIGNTMGSYAGLGSTANLSNHAYLSSNYISGQTDFNTYLASAPTHAEGDSYSWLSAQGTYSGALTFDLGGVFNIQQLAMWNGAGGISASVNHFTVQTSLDSTFSNFSQVGSFTGQQDNYLGTAYDLTDSTARYVRISILDNFGNGCCSAVGALAFDVTPVSAVPEPGSMALIGGGLLAAALRRRKFQVDKSTA